MGSGNCVTYQLKCCSRVDLNWLITLCEDISLLELKITRLEWDKRQSKLVYPIWRIMFSVSYSHSNIIQYSFLMVDGR